MSWLMLHGFTGSPASFARLELPRYVVAPTLGGHLTEPGSTDFWGEVERLAALSPDANELFGYSLGSRLSLGLLARYPDRFDHAVLVSAHPGLRTDAERSLRRADDDRFVRLLRERGLPEFVSAWEKQPLWQTQRALPATARTRRHSERLTHSAEGLARSLTSVGLGHMPDLRAALARSNCSVEFLAGGLDTKFLVLAEELCGIMPRARLRIAANAGHDLVLERPEFCSDILSRGGSQ
jgi:2-succinyl-6-hydroxy-2,4-cyclohexadiene-1-carboxylate synthase